MTTTYALGWKRQPVDARDLRASFPAKDLPSHLDISAGMGSLLDQGQLGACGANSLAEMIVYEQIRQGQGEVTPSRLLLYYNTRILMGDTLHDTGVFNRDMMKAAAKFGFCPESLWPYDVSRFAVVPPKAAQDVAAKSTITQYLAVDHSITAIKNCIANRHPMLFGFDVFKSMMTDQVARSGIVPDPTPGEEPIGGHDIVFVGWDDDTQRFRFRNHWRYGQQWWGQQNYGTISYSYATSGYSADFWCLEGVPGVTPPNPPASDKLIVDVAGKTVSLPSGWKTV